MSDVDRGGGGILHIDGFHPLPSSYCSITDAALATDKDVPLAMAWYHQSKHGVASFRAAACNWPGLEASVC